MKIGFRLAGVLLSLAGSHAWAQTITTELYLDLDANPATGCSVTTVAGTVTGVEARLRASVGGDPPTVEGVTRAECVGGVFAAEQPQSAGYPVGLDVGTDGSDVIELSTPLQGLGDGATTAHFLVHDGDDGDLVQATIVLPGGVDPPVDAAPAIIPSSGWLALLLLVGFTLWAVRRHPAIGSTLAVLLLMGSGITWAANFITDGQIFDWSGVAPVATDPPDGANAAADLVAVFAATEQGRLFVRFDVRDVEQQANQLPSLADASFDIDENSPAGTPVGTVTGTDPDAGQTLAYAITAGNTGTTFAIDATTGTITVADPAALDAETMAQFSLTVSATDDGEPAQSDSATVTIAVNDINEAPTANDAAFDVAEGAATGTVAGTVDATDPDAAAPNNTLTFSITAGNTGNAFAIDAATGTVTVATGSAVNLANAPFTLTVAVSDGGTPALQDTATVTITVSDENDAPVFDQSTYAFAIDENSAADTPVGNVAATDPDAADTLVYTMAAGNDAAAFAIDPATGAIRVAAGAMLDAETLPAYTLTVSATDDGTPALSASATVSVTINDVNEAPTLADAAFDVPEHSAAGTVVGTVAGTDPDATAPFATLAYAITAGNTDGTFAIDAGTGTLQIADATLFDFESGASFVLTVTATDGGGLADSAQVTVTPTDINEAPALADTARSVLQDSAAGTLVGAPLAGVDPDTAAPFSTLTYAITGGNAGSPFAIDADSGQLAVANASLIVEGASFPLAVTVTDGGGLSDTATVTVDVTDVNDAPSFTAGPSQLVLEDAGPQSLLWATDIDDNDPGTQTLTFLVSHDNAALFAAAPAIGAAGVLTYETAPDANGSATVTVALQDDGGTANGGVDTSAPQTFTITVTPVNDAPTFVAGSDVSLDEDASAQSIAGWASAISPGPANEAGQTVTFTVDNSSPALFSVPVAITPDGMLTFTPAADANGVATLTVRAVDNGGTADGGIDTSAPQTATITIETVDDAPVAVADSATVLEDAAATPIAVLANDTDVDGGPIAIASVSQPANGVVVITGGGTGLTYQPSANYCNTPPGTTSDTFTYTLAPGGSTASVAVSVTCVDDAPVAVADTATVTEDDGATAIGVLANDTDVDGGPIAIAFVTQPANGIVLITGGGTGLSYQPPANYCNTPPGSAQDTFTYTLTPGGSTASVSVSVTCVDDAPIAVADAATVAQNAAATAIPVLANDTDIDGGPRSIASVTQPANGTVVITGGGTGLTYQPQTGYCNTPPGTTPDTFTYTLAPGGSSATVSMTVTCPDSIAITSDGGGDEAQLNYPSFGTIPVTTVQATVSAGNPAITYALAGGADQARFTINATSGELRFVTPPDVATPTDANTDNVYEVVVQSSSGALMDTQALDVTIVEGLAVLAKRVLLMRDSEGGDLDIRVLDANGDIDPGAPYTISYTSPAIAITATGAVSVLQPGQSNTTVTITSPGRSPWTSVVAVRTVITDVSPGHNSSQAISTSDQFSAFGSNAGLPTTSYYADFYRIVLPAGELEVIMDSGDDLDTYLLLANDQGFLVAGNDDDDDGALGVGSRLRFTVTEPRVYHIEASTFNGLDTGAYNFAVNFTPAEVDVGAFALNGTCGVLGVQGPGFTLQSPQALPIGTNILVNGSGVPNIGVWSVTGGTANVTVLSGTSRLITLTSALPAGQIMAFRTTLSTTVAWTLNGVTSLPSGYVGTGSKTAGSVTSTLVLCTTT